MKRIFFFLLLSIAHASTAQTVFCVPGATWMYESNSGGAPNPPRQYHITYQGDTTINGFTDVKVLKEELRQIVIWNESISYIETKRYLRIENDSVFTFSNDSFNFVFDLDAQAGDTRVVSIAGGEMCLGVDTMLIDSVTTYEYQGELLRLFHYTILFDDQLAAGPPWYWSGQKNGRYAERIGFMTDHPVNNWLQCDTQFNHYDPANLVCYTDDDIGANYPNTCNLFLDASEPETPETSVTVYQGQVLVQNAPNSTLHVYDILGKELFQEPIASDNQSFDISQLPNGILMVVVEGKSNRFTSKGLNGI